jgi:hypothetical protein
VGIRHINRFFKMYGSLYRRCLRPPTISCQIGTAGQEAGYGTQRQETPYRLQGYHSHFVLCLQQRGAMARGYQLLAADAPAKHVTY